ncbi:MAG TPA: LPS assembly protein LptD [Chthoniobacterales bacterium]
MPKVADAPVEITSDSDFRFEGGVGIAEGNVVIYSKDSTIYCDYAQYNPDTKDVLLKGHVKIYQAALVFSGESALYNLDTKNLRASDFLGASLPYRFQGENLYTIPGGYGVKNGFFTTHDSSNPDFRIRARTVRIYPDDRIVFSNVTLFVGKTPIFWLPYLYQSLNETNSFLIMPGYSSKWGAFVMSTYTFPVTDWMTGTAHLDYRLERGPAAGLDLRYRFGKGETKSWGDIVTYFLSDNATDTNTTSLTRPPVPTDRYRLGWKSKMYLTEDWTAMVDSTILSDSLFLEDFYPGENALNPQPDNVFSTVYRRENWTLTGLARAQLNQFQETVERLPDVSLDITRTQLFGLPIYYEGSTSGGYITEAFADTSTLEKLETGRFDTFHQLSFANTYFGWLSLVPRAGFRATYYDRTNSLVSGSTTNNDPGWRTVYDLGVEASFKLSRTWNNVHSRFLGVDGLKHVVQPYTNFSYTSEPSLTAQELYPIDTFIPSTQLPMFEFPEFIALDSIEQATILRLGLRNRLLTKRDDQTVVWMELDTYFNVNYDNPYDATDYSNLFNRFRFSPLPWVSFTLDSQFPVFDDGFTEVNSSLSFMASKDLSFSVGQRYIENNPEIQDSNLLNFGVYYQIDENWAVSAAEEYEFEDSTWQSQRYSVHRDLTAWVATVSAIIRDNGGTHQEFGFYLSLTLKDVPNLDLSLNFDPSSSGQDSN